MSAAISKLQNLKSSASKGSGSPAARVASGIAFVTKSIDASRM